MFSKKLSEAVLSICDMRELTYETASELCNLSPRYFGSIARGQTAPTVNTLEKLCNGLEHTPNELLGVAAVEEAFSYRAAMQVTHYRKFPYLSGSYTTFPVCPRCHHDLEREYQCYCEQCGQRLGWSGYSHAKLLSDLQEEGCAGKQDK